MSNPPARTRTRRRRAGCLLTAIVLMAGTLGLVFLGGPDVKSDAKASFDAGEAAYVDGRFDDAAAAYLQASQLDRSNPQILARVGETALWANRAADAQAAFEAALEHTPWYQRLWPLTAQLNARLAEARYRVDAFASASQAYLDAAGPIAVGPFAELRALGRQAALFANRNPYRIEGPAESRVPFLMTDPLPVVNVSVNGGDPLPFLIDTGGAEVILDRGLAQRLNVVVSGSISGAYAGGKPAETGLGRLDSLKLGDETISDLPIHVLDIADMLAGEFNGVRVQGVIGTRLLMHFIATIDYPGGALVLRQLTPGNLAALAVRAGSPGARSIPCWLAEMHYILARGTVNGQGPMLFLVDTGLAGSGFTAPPDVLNAAGITVDWTRAGEGAGGGGTTRAAPFVVDHLTLGAGANQLAADNVPGVAIEGGAPVFGNQLGFQVGGVISHAFFRQHALTLDFTGMRLLVE